jgi:hypothetical protein
MTGAIMQDGMPELKGNLGDSGGEIMNYERGIMRGES